MSQEDLREVSREEGKGQNTWLSRRLGNQRSEIDISLSESKAGHSVYFIILDSLGSL
jgi:hypothetical protein